MPDSSSNIRTTVARTAASLDWRHGTEFEARDVVSRSEESYAYIRRSPSPGSLESNTASVTKRFSARQILYTHSEHLEDLGVMFTLSDPLTAIRKIEKSPGTRVREGGCAIHRQAAVGLKAQG